MPEEQKPWKHYRSPGLGRKQFRTLKANSRISVVSCLIGKKPLKRAKWSREMAVGMWQSQYWHTHPTECIEAWVASEEPFPSRQPAFYAVATGSANASPFSGP
ncbi:hypothetical protein M5D96_009860 [Drosophila gunungcola]|uniref:Uncharacterized protein n=1 Tax=Drosophila gunungcola TaxID=103775 RepID=A0A9P9YHL2_9MUSC|nr:hypothetical protein M5D96_009860 [Drosophila gunungcola]